jgi:hypothetical protein
MNGHLSITEAIEVNPPKVRIALIGFLRQELISADQIV